MVPTSDGLIVCVIAPLLLDTRVNGIIRPDVYTTSANVSKAGVNVGTVRIMGDCDIPYTFPAISLPTTLICQFPVPMIEPGFNEMVIWSKFVIVVLAPVGLIVKLIEGVLLAADGDINGMFMPVGYLVPASPGSVNVVVTSVVPFLANVISKLMLVVCGTFINVINGMRK